jgi:hypothetical protein
MSDLTQQPTVELSPWPMSVTVSTEPEVIVTVTGISGNSYVVLRDGAAIGFVSHTTANEDNVEAELPILWATPFVPPTPPPSPVTPLQIRRALNSVGMRSQVEAILVAASQDAKDAWEFASEINRYDPMLCTMASSLGMTEEEIDQVFTLAATFK